MNIVVFGLSLSSSWGNGHATTWRALRRGLAERGHAVLFYERREPWYEQNRDLPPDPGLRFYDDAAALLERPEPALEEADLVIIGSYVRDTALLARRLRDLVPGLLAYYDIDTPVTLAGLVQDRCPYLPRALLPLFDLYFSFSGGAALQQLRGLGVERPVALYCSADPAVHAPADVGRDLDLGYLGTYAVDRQAGLHELLIEPARAWPGGKFAVAGPQFPDVADWPANVAHVEHLPPAAHAAFYGRQRYALNLTRADMRRLGHSPSVRLFEAAACGTPVISDRWPGLEELFEPGREILLAENRNEVLRILKETGETERAAMAAAARERVLSAHTATHRAAELEASVSALG